MILQDIIGLTGLDEGTHAVVMIAVSVIGSIIAAIVMPRILAPLFVKIKNKVFWRYKNGYVLKTSFVFKKKKILLRVLYIFLLILGFLAFLLPIIDPNVILGTEMAESYEIQGIPAQYSLGVLFTVTAIILPITTGLWAISWALEDSGLMHYKFDDRVGYELYEIEPIHIRYSSILRGFSGISAIIFFYSIVYFFTTVNERPYWMSDVIFSALFPIIFAFLSLPGYYFYGKFLSQGKYLKKGLTELALLSEEDIKK